ncbi:hypothetical protein [Asticcacaulis sp.]|uniref:hypothetical protein n=1 Tax=Asticcacaulis sp. TaxID=1872648 RepID=UPI002CABAF3E|nr:hypothetical protein [Asticcacaulis sp.]HTM81573.1 hypothetical protein [Asticcacaulis sp.]
MSDPIGKCRSNYFKVKDKSAFEAWILEFDVDLVWSEDRVAFLGNADDGGIPDRFASEDDLETVSLEEDLHQYLEDGEVCVVFNVGSERLRVLWGGAVAIHSSGATVSVRLDDIYELARTTFEMANRPSPAEY